MFVATGDVWLSESERACIGRAMQAATDMMEERHGRVDPCPTVLGGGSAQDYFSDWNDEWRSWFDTALLLEECGTAQTGITRAGYDAIVDQTTVDVPFIAYCGMWEEFINERHSRPGIQSVPPHVSYTECRRFVPRWREFEPRYPDDVRRPSLEYPRIVV